MAPALFIGAWLCALFLLLVAPVEASLRSPGIKKQRSVFKHPPSLHSSSSSSLLTAQDTPYEETIATRMPFAGSFTDGYVPTNWIQLECSNMTSVVVVSVINFTSSTSISRSLGYCPGESLILDIETNYAYAVQGDADFTVGTWIFAPYVSGAAVSLPSSWVAPPLIAISDTQIVSLTCTFAPSGNNHGGLGEGGTTAGTCEATVVVNGHDIANITTAGIYPSITSNSTWWTVWIGGANGTAAWDISPLSTRLHPFNNTTTSSTPTPPTPLPRLSPAIPLVSMPGIATSAIAFSPIVGVVALGNSSMLSFYSATSFLLLRWEWVTYVPDASGGLIDDVITSLAFDDAADDGGVSSGVILYIGNPTCLNIALFPPSSSSSSSATASAFVAPSFLRLAGVDGLPYPNITSLAIDLSSPPGRDVTTPGVPRRLYIGTLAGVILFDPLAQSQKEYAQQVQEQNQLNVERMRMKTTQDLSSSSSSSLSSSPSSYSLLTVPWEQRWRFFAGARWLAVSAADTYGSSVMNLVSYPVTLSPPPPGSTSPLATANGGVLVQTIQGLSTLDSYTYTLAMKAAFFESTLPKFALNITGLIAGCPLPSFGTLGLCTAAQPDANNGLWTSLLVASFAAKYTVTGAPADAATAVGYLEGLYNLNTVTGIQGLFARACLPPSMPPPEGWYNSTSKPGWTWEGDTSSDEVAGHTMAYTVGQLWLANVTQEKTMDEQEIDGEPKGEQKGRSSISSSSPSEDAASTLLHLVRYVVGNNFTLIDITGKPTTWGHWDPPAINGNRACSDERGLNPTEMMAMLTGALVAANVSGSGGGANDTLAFTNAAEYLVSPNIDYANNMLNAKIIVPDDDNYSDDELLWFSYFPILLATAPTEEEEEAVAKERGSVGGVVASVRAATLTSLVRSWSLVAFSRPSLWNIISLALLGANATGYKHVNVQTTLFLSSASKYFFKNKGRHIVDSSSSNHAPDPAAALADSFWHLRSWALEPIDWPVKNSIRHDIFIDPEIDRDNNFNTQAMDVFPNNEISMFRWNADARTLDGGSGTYAIDPGAYMMPYWLGRKYGFIDAAE